MRGADVVVLTSEGKSSLPSEDKPSAGGVTLYVPQRIVGLDECLYSVCSAPSVFCLHL